MRLALSVTPECVPLVKTGGLADVAGALPAALAAQGWALRTLLPGYPSVLAAIGEGQTLWQDGDLFGGPARVIAAGTGDLDLLVLDAPHLYDRAGNIYLAPGGADWPDNPERFAALSWVAARIGAGDLADGWRPEVIHLHDWQAALTPTYLRAMQVDVPTLLTIHNIAFHGMAPADRLFALRLPPERFSARGFEFYGRISALKAGLVDATRLTTVSPTYAAELLTPEFGMGMDGVLRDRAADLVGILNGIDPAHWTPATDPHVSAFRAPAGKARNKAALQADYGIEPGPGPLAIVISRLTAQKGLDLLLDALPGFLDAGGQLALIGSGDPVLEAGFLAAADHPRVGVRIGYDEPLSHRMFAGGDAVLVPSRFEPCGLTQMYGLRYGAVPVVARTGGLADTVIDANAAALRAGVATGIVFGPVTAPALGTALDRLCALYADPAAFARVQKNGMKHPVDWGPSAAQYAGLYAAMTD